MSEHNSNHSGNDHERSGGLDPQNMDPAQQQLAKALQSSFRLLSFIMIIVVVLFLFTGFAGIDSTQVGLVSRFGKIVKVAEEGFTYAWPFPVGKIERIDISQRELEVNDFWMFETPEDQTKPLTARRSQSEGLRPGFDGVLLTGDHGLYHVKLKCGFRVSRNWDIESQMDPAMMYYLNVSDPAETIRSTVCAAAIDAASQTTAEMLRTQKKDFESVVRAEAQERLDGLKTGLELTFVSIVQDSWPIRVLPMFIQAQNAHSQMETIRNEARGEAVKILSEAAGNNYVKLVGDITNVQASKLDRGLLGEYIKARNTNDVQLQAEILNNISDVLTDGETSGQARRVIMNARAESTQFVENIKSRAEEFTQLKEKFADNPEFMLAARWAETLEAILSSDTVESIIVDGSGSKINLITKQNPEIAKKINRAKAQTAEKK